MQGKEVTIRRGKKYFREHGTRQKQVVNYGSINRLRQWLSELSLLFKSRRQGVITLSRKNTRGNHICGIVKLQRDINLALGLRLVWVS